MGEYDPAPGAKLIPPTPNEYEPAPDAQLIAPGTPQESAGRSFALQASNVFGAAPVISGLIRRVTEGVPYAQGRDEYQAQIDAAKDQHPTASTLGSVASLVPETVIGGGVGRVAGAVGKAAGLAAKAAPFIEAHPLITKAVEGALGGAGYGAASGAGSAAAHGQDILPAAAESAAGGGVVGGVLGGAAAKLGDVLSNGVANQNASIVRGAAERALPKKQGALASLIEDSETVKPFAKKASINVDDVIQENRDILGGARSNDYDTVSKTRQAIESKVSSYEAAKKQSYGLVDEATKGGVDAGDLTEALKNKAARVDDRGYKKVLLNKAANLEEDFASIGTDEAKTRLMRLAPTPGSREVVANYIDTLPEGKQWNKEAFLNHLVGDAKSADFDPDVRKAIEALPYKFDPTYKIPSQEIRKLLTSSQEEAESALGTLNATKNAKLASQNQAVIGSVMNKTLDAAAKSDVEGITDAVQNIHDTNLRQSVLLRLDEGLEPKENKLKLGKLGLGATASKVAGHAAGATPGLYAAGHDIVEGKYEDIPKDLAIAGVGALAGRYAGRVAPRLAALPIDAAASSNRVLQRITQAAADGSPKAKALLASLQASKKIGTAGAGAVGSVSSGTLGQKDSQ